MEKISKYLKELREEKELSLDEISEKTKIHIKILEAIENNDMKYLKERGYYHLFVLSYARFLKADMDLVEREINPHRTKKKTPSDFFQSRDKKKKIMISTKFFSITFLVIFTLILAFIAYRLYKDDKISLPSFKPVSTFFKEKSKPQNDKKDKIVPMIDLDEDDNNENNEREKQNEETEIDTDLLRGNTDFVKDYVVSEDSPVNENIPDSLELKSKKD